MKSGREKKLDNVNVKMTLNWSPKIYKGSNSLLLDIYFLIAMLGMKMRERKKILPHEWSGPMRM